MSDLGSVAQVGSAVFAAAAAGASWASVLQSRKITRAAIEPQLHAQVMEVGLMSRGGPARLAFTIHNAGGGLAKATGYCVATAAHFCVGYLADGFLRSNQTAYLGTEMTPAPPTVGVVWCLDSRQVGHVWNLAGDHKTFKFSANRPYVRPTEVLALHHPDVELDRLHQVPGLLSGPPTGSPLG